MKKRLLSLAVALAILCQTVAALAAFGPFDAVATCPAATPNCTRLKDLGTKPDPLVPNEKWRMGAIITPIVNLADGEEVCALTVADCYRWDKASTATPDDIEIVNPIANSGNGRFYRVFRRAPKWLLQDWYINESTGHDENPGTALLPLKTDRELYRRWGHARLAVAVTVTYLATPVAQTNYDVELLPDAALTIIGTPTTNKASIAISAVTAQVRTAGAEVALAVTGSTLGAADVGKIAIIRSGTAGNIGAYARILKDNGSGSVRVSPFGKASLATFPPFTQVTPLVNDVIDVITPMTLSVGNIRVVSATNSPINGSPSRNAVMFDSVTLDGSAASFGAGAISIADVCGLYARSILKDIHLVGSSDYGSLGHLVAGGGTTSTVAIGTQAAFFFKTGSLSSTVTVRPSGYLSVDADSYFQASQLVADNGGIVNSNGAAFFDGAATGTAFVAPGGVWRQTGAVPDWGAANAGFGIIIQSGGNYVYGTKPTINSGLGGSRETRVGGTVKLYSAIPYFETVNGASIVLLQ